MSTASVTTPALLTAEEFAQRPDPGYPEELVEEGSCRRRCPSRVTVKSAIGSAESWAIAEDRDLGRVLSNDTGVITERGPDTVRGADISFYSFARVPKGPLPDRYLDTPPDLVVEVLSPSDRWPKVLAKVAEYLDAGTTIVLVLDDPRRLAHLYRADGTTRLLGADEELTIPDLLGDFHVRVGRFFE